VERDALKAGKGAGRSFAAAKLAEDGLKRWVELECRAPSALRYPMPAPKK